MSEVNEEKQLFDGQGVIQFNKEVDRRNFLKYAGVVGVGSGLVLTGVACSPRDDADRKSTSPGPTEPAEENPDTGILNYALTLEYLEADFYAQGVAGSMLSGRELELIKPIAEHEQAHVDALAATVEKVGGTPVEKPNFIYPNETFTDKAAFLKTASVFEELGVNAYQGQVTAIQTPEILGAAASIAGVESRHAAILATLIGGKPFPAAVEGTKTMEEVLEAAKPFIKS